MDIYPNKIKISGLPSTLQGWNTTFYKTQEVSEGCPVYKLDPYILYFFVPIIGVTIYRLNGQWTMKRESDSFPMNIIKISNQDQSSPIGEWTFGAEVASVDLTD